MKVFSSDQDSQRPSSRSPFS